MTPSSGMEFENKALIRRWFEEVWNHGRVDLIDELRAPEIVAAGLGEGMSEHHGHEPFLAFYSNLRDAFPDLHVEIEDMISEGDKIAVRITFSGTHLGNSLGAPTGSSVRFGAIVMARISGGRIVEAWNSLDQLGILRQIGALPVPGVPENFLLVRGD